MAVTVVGQECVALKPSWEMAVFYDGDCPLCRQEIAWLQRKDVRQRIKFIDIAAEQFEAAKHGKTQSQLMAVMHGQLADGTWTVGVDTFVHLYRLLEMGWVVGWTRWPVFRSLTDAVYLVFAKIRTRLPGRSAGSCRQDGQCSSGPA